MSDDVIAHSVAEAIIEAPLASIDLTNWVFTITDAEYRACSTAHLAAAATHAPDGRRMSINVEKVGNLMVQHYVEDIAEAHHVRLVSQTESIGPALGDVAIVRVIWEFTAEAAGEKRTRFVNHTAAHALPGYREALEGRGIPFEKASEAATKAMTAHNLEETPLFAADITRKANAGRWRPTAKG